MPSAMSLLRRLLLPLCLLFTLPAAATPPLTVFAAASLQEALDAVVAAWRDQGGGAVRVSYGASSALARQIEQGAPADLYFAADRDWMNHLHTRGRIAADSRHDLLGNRLVLIAPRDAALPAFAFDLQAPLPRPLPLAADQRLAMALTDSVPAGKYGKAALTRFGLWAGVADRVVEAENVRAALLLVARGEAALGIVYRTDALVEPRVRVVAELPFGSHPRIVYPVARIAASTHPEAAGFLAFLRGPTAAALFRERGFQVFE
jgi:molybdate transport system substrate-binding protein